MKGKWTKIDPRNRIAVIKHTFHMLGNICAAHKPNNIDINVLEKARGTLWDANIVAISAETCKYIADHLDFQESQVRMLKARIAELEKE